MDIFFVAVGPNKLCHFGTAESSDLAFAFFKLNKRTKYKLIGLLNFCRIYFVEETICFLVTLPKGSSVILTQARNGVS